MDTANKASIAFLIVRISCGLLCVNCDLRDVHIIQRGGNQYEAHEAFTLNQFCPKVGDMFDSTVIAFDGGDHDLNVACIFKNTENITLRGTATIFCASSKDSGFQFVNVTELKISDLTFVGCGTKFDYSGPKLRGTFSDIMSALLFVSGSEHTLAKIKVVNATSAGIYILNVAGSVSMDSCEVTNATSSIMGTLSGNIIVYDRLDTSNLTIVNTQFTGNGYLNLHKKKCKYNDAFLYSSGLALFLGSHLVNIYIENTTFSKNSGCNGGNMAVLFFSHTSLTIFNTTFTSGRARYGGGVYVSFENSFLDNSKDDCSNSSLSIVNSSFESNFAFSSGGGAYVHWKQSLIVKSKYDIEIAETVFAKNSILGSGGTAFHCMTYTESNDNPDNFPKFHVSLKLTNCLFHHHSPNISSSSESSVIFAANVPYLGVYGITVKFNHCSGILAIGSTLVFHNYTTIQNNTAFTGGGVRLCSDATIYLTPNTNLVITKNSAQQTGGGIQVYSNCLIAKPACFFQYSRYFWTSRNNSLSTTNFIVSENQARNGGDNIYGGEIDYCYFLFIRSIDKKFRSHLKVPNNTLHQPSSVSSDPQQVCFNNFSQDSVGEFRCNNTADVNIYPGEKITLFVRVVGQHFGAVPGTVLAGISGGVVIKDSEKAHAVGILGENVNYTVYSSQQDIRSDDAAVIYLKAGLKNDTEYGHKQAEINIRFKQCPFGFSNMKDSSSPSQYSCTCSMKGYKTCSIQHQVITKLQNYWLGGFKIHNHTYPAHNRYCPLDYCSSSREIKSNAFSLSQDEQCQYNRTGILCGSCPEGWSLVLGSSECREDCTNGWLLLSLAFALAGLLLVVFIHFLNLTVTMGTVCGLIFYANIVRDYSIVLLTDKPIPGLTPILQVFLSWLNLDLGIPTCFYDGMEAFGKTMLLFVFPVYIWLISATIIFFSRRYIFITSLVGENAVKVLSTLFLLSYSKILRVTIGVLNVKHLAVHINDSFSVYEWRWTMDGNISYFDHRHNALLIIALLLIMLLLPFTFSLLCIRHVYALSNCSRLFSWIDKLKPFFDTYTGPYKDKARFWTGLLLFVRLLLLIMQTLDYNYAWIPYYVITSVCLSLLAIFICLQGIYKKRHLNVLECFFVLNIAFLFLNGTVPHSSHLWKTIVSHLLVGSAFLAFLVIICYHFHLKFSRLRLTKRLMFWRRNPNIDLLSFDREEG